MTQMFNSLRDNEVCMTDRLTSNGTKQRPLQMRANMAFRLTLGVRFSTIPFFLPWPIWSIARVKNGGSR